jgi:hypothetical protein
MKWEPGKKEDKMIKIKRSGLCYRWKHGKHSGTLTAPVNEGEGIRFKWDDQIPINWAMIVREIEKAWEEVYSPEAFEILKQFDKSSAFRGRLLAVDFRDKTVMVELERMPQSLSLSSRCGVVICGEAEEEFQATEQMIRNVLKHDPPATPPTQDWSVEELTAAGSVLERDGRIWHMCSVSFSGHVTVTTSEVIPPNERRLWHLLRPRSVESRDD